MPKWNPTRFTDVGLAMLVIMAIFNYLRVAFPVGDLLMLITAVGVWVFASIALHRFLYMIQE